MFSKILATCTTKAEKSAFIDEYLTGQSAMTSITGRE